MSPSRPTYSAIESIGTASTCSPAASQTLSPSRSCSCAYLHAAHELHVGHLSGPAEGQLAVEGATSFDLSVSVFGKQLASLPLELPGRQAMSSSAGRRQTTR
eukprot:764106-Hanusia_phi.AAC.8